MESLFTHQDGKYGHIHKTIGFLSLAHFFARFASFTMHGTMGFNNTNIWFWLGIHAILSGSSMIFYLSNFRSIKAPMIWPEFRAHSILFAYRSLVAMALASAGYSNSLTRSLTVIGTISLADLATKYYLQENTTMRDMPFPVWVTPRMKNSINLYYSVSQVFATLIILLKPDTERLFLILFPIQIAAFLMTLVRKNMLSPLGWHILYGGSLGLNYIYGWITPSLVGDYFYQFALLFCIARFGYRVNKYILWSGIGVTHIYLEYGSKNLIY
jgi:hypothetical protein